MEDKQACLFCWELLFLNHSPHTLAPLQLPTLFPAYLSDSSDCKLRNIARPTLGHPQVFGHYPNIHGHYEDLEVSE